jgi:hypothetical protein
MVQTSTADPAMLLIIYWTVVRVVEGAQSRTRWDSWAQLLSIALLTMPLIGKPDTGSLSHTRPDLLHSGHKNNSCRCKSSIMKNAE